MKTSELIFGKNVENPEFLKDLEFMFNLSEEKMEKILSVYLASEYRTAVHHNLDSFAKEIDLDFENAHSIVHFLDMFAYHVVPKHEINDINSALDEALNKYNIETSNLFLSKLREENTQNLLDKLARIDDEIGEINPRFDQITYNIQNRVVIKSNKILKRFPIATIYLDTTKDDNCVFEMLEDDIDELIKDLSKIKQHLNLIKGVGK